MSKRLTLIPITGLVLLTLAGCATTPNGTGANKNRVTNSTTNTSAANVVSNSTLKAPASSDGSTSKPASNTITQPSNHSANSQLSTSLAARMKNVAGISDPAAFVQGFNQLKTDVAQGNKAKVAAFGAYPMNVYTGGKKQTIANAQAFVQNYDAIMTSKVKSAITAQQVNQLFVNWEGVMVGNGEVWLTQSGSSKCSIIAINH